MIWVDWVIVLVIVLAVLVRIGAGLLPLSLLAAGLLLGLALAAWHYGRLAALLMFYVHDEAVADVIGFLAIAFAVMALFGMAGQFLAKTVHGMGSGLPGPCLFGAAFGFLQGALLVTVVHSGDSWLFSRIAHWLVRAKLPKIVFWGLSYDHAHEPGRDWPSASGTGSSCWRKKRPGGCTPARAECELRQGAVQRDR